MKKLVLKGVVRPGQVWQDCDTRMPARWILVLSVCTGFAKVARCDPEGKLLSGRKPRVTQIRVDRMRPGATGYRFTGVVAQLLVLLVLSVTQACDSTVGTDQCLRRELFNECLQNIPVEPGSSRRADWAGVVQGCSDYSYLTAKRQYSSIPASCR